MQYRDPQSIALQKETGLTARQIVNAAKKHGIPRRKIYGRYWVAADFAERLKQQNKDD